jgi:energy-coupling factor transport system substrate-specific component
MIGPFGCSLPLTSAAVLPREGGRPSRLANNGYTSACVTEVSSVRDVIAMWRHTKMVVLVALSAAVYAALLVPFKPVVIVPGYAELRPAGTIPILCGMLFGPAAAWGSAFGNLVGDVFGGMLGPGSVPGMIGNFLLAYLPYRAWRVLRGDRPADGSARGLGAFAVCVIAGSFSCAVVIGYGVGALRLPIPVPYFVLSLVIAGNNLLMGLVLGAPLLALLYPRAKKWGLVYSDVMAARDYRGGLVGWPGLVITLAGSLAGVLLAANDLPTAISEAEVASPYLPVLPPGLSLLYALGVCSLVVLIGTVLTSPLGRSFGVIEERQKEEAEPDEEPEAAQEGEQ